jgi:hypothetical protein
VPPESSYGLAVAPSFRQSALATVSARALRLWLLLASQVALTTCKRQIDGEWITVNAGDVLISTRTLVKQIGGGRNQLLAALAELETAGAIATEPVERATVPEQNRQRFQSGTVQRFGNRTAVRCLLSRITVNGIRHLRQTNGSKLEPQEYKQATTSPSAEIERAKAERLLVLEGR